MIDRLQTEVDIRPARNGFSISYNDRLTFLGSCFADEMGRRFKDSGFHMNLNPFGTLYNPASILSSLKRLSSPVEFTMDDVVCSNGIYCSFSHHSSFADIDPEVFLGKANVALKEASEFYCKSSVLIVTLGTARVYICRKSGNVVSNCHKLPPGIFQERMMSVEECISVLEEMVETAQSDGIKHIVLTVSPIRHLKDGLHTNNLSKSTLLLAVDHICRKYECCMYFPAYEIVMDELRDYRFYADDLCHPSAKTIGYVWKRFMDFSMDEPTVSLIREISSIKAAMGHRPMFPESENWRKFVSDLEKRKKGLLMRHPEIDAGF